MSWGRSATRDGTSLLLWDSTSRMDTIRVNTESGLSERLLIEARIAKRGRGGELMESGRVLNSPSASSNVRPCHRF